MPEPMKKAGIVGRNSIFASKPASTIKIVDF